jgi:hypothetical protein
MYPRTVVASFRVDATRKRERCDRCRCLIEDGYTWPGLGFPLTLCLDCTHDIEESVKSYGETGAAARERFMDRLRNIGTD